MFVVCFCLVYPNNFIRVHLIDAEGKSIIVLVCEKLFSFDHTGELLWSTTLDKQNISLDFADMMLIRGSSEVLVIGAQNKKTIFSRISVKTGHFIGNVQTSSPVKTDKYQFLLCISFHETNA